MKFNYQKWSLEVIVQQKESLMKTGFDIFMNFEHIKNKFELMCYAYRGT